MKQQELSQKEIAERLGISSATVSLVLRNPDTNRASAKTKQRIFEYAPPKDRAARKPSTRADTFVFVMSDDEKRFFYQQSMLQGAQERAAELGMKLEVVNPRQDLQSLISARYVQGLVLETPRLSGPQIKQLKRRFRTVGLNAYLHDDTDGISIMGDSFGGFRLALRELLKLGHERVAYLGYEDIPENRDQRNHERSAAFTETCHTLGVALADDAVAHIPSTAHERIDRSREIGQVLSAWFDQPQPPTALLCHNDLLAARTLMVALEMGIRIPEQLSLIGYDNEALCNMLTPQLTSICPQFAQMGRLAVTTLNEDTLWDEDGTPYRLVVPAQLKVRKSVAKPAQHVQLGV